MANFVLVDAPNFVLLSLPDDVLQRSRVECPEYLNPQLGALLKRMGVCAQSDDLRAPIDFDGPARIALRRVLQRYGFELPPLNVAELLGLLDYCDHLDAATGRGVLDRRQCALWQQLAQQLPLSDGACQREAAQLYARGDLAALRELHRLQGTLTKLGRNYHRARG